MSQDTTQPRNRIIEITILLPILVLAAVLRFGWLDVSSYAWDEARISLDALRMARGGEFVLAGQPSSVDIPFFPASVWLFAIPFALSPDPLVATGAVAFVSWLSVIGVWALARRFGLIAGWVAALYMAASPYAIFYGRSIWQPNLLPPLALAWGLAWLFAKERDGCGGLIAAGLFGLLGVLTVQVHFAGIALALGTAYATLRHFRGRKLIALLIGGGVGALATIPYVYYITIVNPAVVGRFSDILGSGSTAYGFEGFGNLIRLALAWDWGFLGLGDYDTFSRTPILALVVGIVLAVGLIGLALVVARRLYSTDGSEGRPYTQRTLSPVIEIILASLIISPLFFIRHSTPVLIHYQLVALPAVAVIFGVAAARWMPRIWRGAVLLAAVGLAGVWSIQVYVTLRDAAYARMPNSALSSILRESRDAALAVKPPVLFFTHGDDPGLHGEVAVFETLLWGRDHQILNGDNLLILPPYPATLMATLPPFQMWEEVQASVLNLNVTTYPRRMGADPFIATTYDGHTPPSGFTALTPVSLADGTTLIGWKARMVGERFRISTLWQVDADALPGTYQQFHHLRTSDTLKGDPLLISDVALSRSTWRVGDRVIVMADFFDAPTDSELVVDIGHYTLPDLVRVNQSNGEPTAIRIALSTN